MINRSKAEAKARFKAKAKAKLKSLAGRGSGSCQGKIPGQPTKLGDGPPTQLKNEKAVEENLAKVQLDKENTTPPKPKPEEKRTSIAVRTGRYFLFTDPCRICNVFGHWPEFCPYLKFVPYNVTKVGKGYEIHDGRNGRYAAPIYCLNCTVPVEHEAEKCPYDS